MNLVKIPRRYQYRSTSRKDDRDGVFQAYGSLYHTPDPGYAQDMTLIPRHGATWYNVSLTGCWPHSSFYVPIPLFVKGGGSCCCMLEVHDFLFYFIGVNSDCCFESLKSLDLVF